ncbi:MAG: hypothetical protein JW702_06280 [Clostridiales bacterium]|nr:hypothetical protein [Clostridiales bacterium]
MIVYGYDFISVSTDGENFKTVLENTGSPFNFIFTDGSKYFMATSDSRYYYWQSNDAENWTLLSDNSCFYNGLTAVTYADGKFIGTDNIGFIMISEDGLNWTTPEIDYMKVHAGDLALVIDYSNGMYYAGGESNFMVGNDYTEWTQIPYSEGYYGFVTDIATDGNRVILATQRGLYSYSDNTMSAINPDTLDGEFSKIIYDENFYAMRSNGDFFQSKDGVEWKIMFESPSTSYV